MVAIYNKRIFQINLQLKSFLWIDPYYDLSWKFNFVLNGDRKMAANKVILYKLPDKNYFINLVVNNANSLLTSWFYLFLVYQTFAVNGKKIPPVGQWSVGF